MNKQNNFEIYINNNLYCTVVDKNEAIWTLGSKFGGIIYNQMYRDNKILFSSNKVEVFTE